MRISFSSASLLSQAGGLGGVYGICTPHLSHCSHPCRLRDGSEYLLRAPSQPLMNEWVSKLQQNSGEQPLLAEQGPGYICAAPTEPSDTSGSEKKQHSIVSDLCILTCLGNHSSLPGRIRRLCFHTTGTVRNSTNDVRGVSAAKSRCQENYNCTLVFLCFLCGAWKPLACPPGKET